ncbi:MAG: TPR repeat-containing protein [Bacteroidetes bacterium]|nr:MAG: TPR repeat-containing protein [Bacteroidota bacterium]
MKKTIVLLFLTYIGWSLSGQNQSIADLENFSIMSPVQSGIYDAKGWSMQDNGTWAHAPNKIPYTDSRSNNARPGGLNELGQDNFISLELRKIMIDDEQYNVLIKKYNDGEFEFSYLQRNWVFFHSMEFWVFKSEKLKELMPEDVQFNVKYLVNLECYVTGKIRNYNKTVFTEEGLNLANYTTGVINNFQTTNTGYYDLIIRIVQDRKLGKTINDGNLIIALYPIRSGDKEVTRFKLIKNYKHENLNKMQLSPDNWKDIFAENFYEVDFNIYNNFINQSLAYYVELGKATTAYDANYQWGVLRYQIGDYLGALEAFNKAFEENPKTDDFMIYSYRGNTRSKMGLHTDAIADFDKALMLRPKRIVDYPNWIRNYFNRGVAKYYINNGTGACEDWKKAYDLGYGSASEYLYDFCGQKTP